MASSISDWCWRRSNRVVFEGNAITSDSWTEAENPEPENDLNWTIDPSAASFLADVKSLLLASCLTAA
ncbi:hypothetical protein [Candidatus Regnicoccus frigidus]|uniref:hypothetical protein n=1 Tax=Candidatus Regnicoccus frigidus TaxID=3074015 RepID=UPI0028BD75C6|nr:hypothetical protein [Candidatus Regnicoccus frigidus]